MGNVILMLTGNYHIRATFEGRKVDLYTVKDVSIQRLLEQYEYENASAVNAEANNGLGSLEIYLDLDNNTVTFTFTDFTGETTTRECDVRKSNTPQTVFNRLKSRLDNLQRGVVSQMLKDNSTWNISIEEE